VSVNVLEINTMNLDVGALVEALTKLIAPRNISR